MNDQEDLRAGSLTRRSAIGLLGIGTAVVAVPGVGDVLWAPSARAADGTDKAVSLVNVRSGLSLDVYGGSTSDGAAVIQWTTTGADHQHWTTTDRDDGWVTVGSVASGKVLDVQDGATADGTRVVQSQVTGRPHQEWRLEDVGKGRVKVVSRPSGKLLTVVGSSTDPGAETEIRSATGEASQLWTVVPTDGYQLDSTTTEARTDAPLADAGGVGGGVAYGVTHNGWSRNDHAWYPISGEFHYVRYPAHRWEHELGKLRAAGVGIVASYVFWNHHERPEGTWDWSGRNNVRDFVIAAGRQGLLVWLRVGPYINAETDNGGIPAHALPGSRSDDAGYLAKVDGYLSRLAEQMDGLFVKDGGPVVGVQVENEFATGDPAHITTLRKMCVEHGLSAPYFTVTANSNFDKNAAIPLQGTYCYRGWEDEGGTSAVSGFIYGTDEWSANTDIGGAKYETLDYPRGFCELGTGSPMRGTSRFQVDHRHVVAQAYDSVGRGANFLGYYMFHGGTQVEGLSGDWPLTYDFQAPMGEFGQLRESYRHYRRLHTFLGSYTDELVRTRITRDPGQIMDPTQTQRLRCIGRFDSSERGFVFVNNVQHNVTLPDRDDMQIRVYTADGTVTLPSKPLPMPQGRFNVFPVRTDLNGVDLRWATVEPLAHVDGDDLPTWVYWAPDWTDRALAFDKSAVLTQELGTFESDMTGDELVATVPAGRRTSLLVHKAQNTQACARIIILSEAESLNTVVAPLDGRERLVITDGAHPTSLQPTVGFTGPAGGRITTDVFPAGGLAPESGWKKAKSAEPFARRTFRLGKAPAAPKVTPAGAGQWRITIDPANLDELAEAQLVLDYRGGDAELVSAGKIITNDLYHGESWTIDLKNLDEKAFEDLTLRVSPWDTAIRGVPRPSGTTPDLPQWTWNPLRGADWS